MSATVKPIRPVENEPDPELLELVEKVLALVRSGEILAVGIIAHHRGGGVGHRYHVSPGGDGAYLIAGAEQIKFRILRANT